MGSLLRSEDMTYVRLYFDNVAAQKTLEELGRAEIIELTDLNEGVSPFQRKHAGDVRRCEEMQRQLRYLAEQANVQDEDLEDLGEEEGGSSASVSTLNRIDDLDVFLRTLESSLKEINVHQRSMEELYQETNEMRMVLETAEDFFQHTERGAGRFVNKLVQGVGKITRSGANAIAELAENDLVNRKDKMLGCIAGIMDTEKKSSFERLLFRGTRGNCFLRTKDVPGGRSTFIVFLTGNKIRAKVEKLCNTFQAHRYPIPETHEQRIKRYDDCLERLREVELVMKTAEDRKQEIIRDYRSQLARWNLFVEEQKAIFHASNMLNYDTSRSLFITEGWIATDDMEVFTDCVKRAQVSSNAQAPSLIEIRSEGRESDAPTLFKLNKFTSIFHSIIEAYGVARYKEINPAPFAVITFPFLFAVMFGDVGHGIIMALFALGLILFENRMSRSKGGNEFLQMCFSGRYIIFLMGLFSIYTGFIYNEAFAVPLNIFGGRWQFTNETNMACGIDNCDDPAAANPPLKPYPFGFDPIWQGSENGLAFFNSYKMKLSIVLGVCHMMVGIFNSFLNAVFFKEPIDVLFMFIPQVIFMGSIFGYLVILIIVKWATNFNSEACQSDPTCQPPDLKSVLIGMFMSPGHVPKEDQLFHGQAALQVVLLLMALVAIPWMLFPKPFLLRRRFVRRKQYERLLPSLGDVDHVPGEDDSYFTRGSDRPETDEGLKPTEPEFNFQDVFVEQLIHTIEFVLGAVSNTASYLRLWALSLAHSELSEVFLEKLIFLPVSMGNPIIIVVGYFFWIAMTLGVLMGMESLSAFLHALRLHWVEFQNKFYNLHGPGRKFSPLILHTTE